MLDLDVIVRPRLAEPRRVLDDASGLLVELSEQCLQIDAHGFPAV